MFESMAETTPEPSASKGSTHKHEPRRDRHQRLRRWTMAAQAALMFGLPFVQVGGQSALRLDVESSSVFVFGARLWFNELLLVATGLLFLAFGFALVTFLFGRVWCGYACPQTVFVELVNLIDGKKKKKRKLRHVIQFLLSAAVAADIIWFFVSPYAFFEGLAQGTLSSTVWTVWAALTAIVFVNLAWIRQKFCATVCPYGRLQNLIFDDQTLVVAYDTPRANLCIGCDLCVKVCPVGVDLRQGLDDACVSCARCVDACAHVMKKRGEGPLLDYFYGLPKAGAPRAKLKLSRPSVVWSALGMSVFLAVTLYLTLGRSPVDMTVLPNYEAPFRRVDGVVLNELVIALESRMNQKVSLRLSAELEGVDVSITPDHVELEAGEYSRLPVTIGVDDPGGGPHEVTVVATPVGIDGVRLTDVAQIHGPEWE